MKWIAEVAPYIGTLIAGGILGKVVDFLVKMFSLKSQKKKADAEADIAEANVDAQEITNEKSSIDIYRSIITDLERHYDKRIQEYRNEIEELRKEINTMKKDFEQRLSSLEAENKRYKEENTILSKENIRFLRILSLVNDCPHSDCPVLKEKETWT